MQIKFLTSLALVGLVTACSSSEDISLSNPSYFLVKVTNGALSGQYNPAGYSSQIAQKQIKGACKGNTLASYGEQTQPNGLVAFNATCPGDPIFGNGNIEIERNPEGNYWFEATGY
ncbi:hypothetical protein [uncultured Roseovarius sp.]|uniref:hypothetical protein n=1 Tax=Roseovarius sp. TaxID=1486281 RepID=UPI0026000646|nr:hypothetical protein [uncultured Roseovarius sp.]